MCILYVQPQDEKLRAKMCFDCLIEKTPTHVLEHISILFSSLSRYLSCHQAITRRVSLSPACARLCLQNTNRLFTLMMRPRIPRPLFTGARENTFPPRPLRTVSSWPLVTRLVCHIYLWLHNFEYILNILNKILLLRTPPEGEGIFFWGYVLATAMRIS